MKVLVVVDMQASYLAAQDRTLIERIEVARQHFIADGGRVVFVCYDGSGMHTVKTDGADVLWKNENDGGTMVYSWLLGAGLVSDDLRVTFAGVNLCACVFQSASGLAARLYDEHALCDHVSIDTSLCGDGAKFKVRLTNGHA